MSFIWGAPLAETNQPARVLFVGFSGGALAKAFEPAKGYFVRRRRDFFAGC